MIFEKPFKGVPDGEIYPVDYEPGDECPPELEAAAIECGAVTPEEGAAKPTAAKKASAK
ncbi:hypothetical protein [Duganella aquatilis]|uniref:hypothetical protein n=1 Tax=Duganella aquatilis TaxID=2666082 RepID=UPI00140D3486|nr:hypothetical protein [Duganella aquatilis]